MSAACPYGAGTCSYLQSHLASEEGREVQHQQQQLRQQRLTHQQQRQHQQLGVLLFQYPGAAVGCVAELILRVDTLN